jgi:hypothetical protein
VPTRKPSTAERKESTCFEPSCSNPVMKCLTGRAPLCEECKKVSKTTANQVQRDRRARLGPKPPRERECRRCLEMYWYTPKRGSNVGICSPCVPLYEAEQREERLERRRLRREAEPEPQKIKRNADNFRKKLIKAGLLAPDEVLDPSTLFCGICKSTDPGERNWAIDHDHSCCPKGSFCLSCVRGLLCNVCNLGLGMFNDNIATLLSAIDWIKAGGPCQDARLQPN